MNNQVIGNIILESSHEVPEVTIIAEKNDKLAKKDATIANKDSEIAQLRAELEKYKSMNK